MPAPTAHPALLDGGTKELLSGQALPELLLCVLSEWEGQVPLGTWQCTGRRWPVGFNATLQAHVDFQGRNRLVFQQNCRHSQPSAAQRCEDVTFWKNQICLVNIVLVGRSPASSLEMKLFQCAMKRCVCRLADLHKMEYFILYTKNVFIQKRLELFHSTGKGLFSHEMENKLIWYFDYRTKYNVCFQWRKSNDIYNQLCSSLELHCWIINSQIFL